MNMTAEHAKELYRAVVERGMPKWERLPDDASEWSSVVPEMQAVVAAPTDEDATKAIAWWWNYDPDSTPRPLTVARRLRKQWAKMQEERA